MSTEHNHFRASCNVCGHEGVWTVYSDDWGAMVTRLRASSRYILIRMRYFESELERRT